MDTLSSSVSSLTVPNLRRYSADFYHFKNPYTTTSSSSSPHFNFPKPTSISNKTNYFTHKKTTNFPFLSKNAPPKQPFSKHQTPHTRSSSGYAAALIDIANRNNSLEKLDKDVRRLSRWLRNDQLRVVMTDPFVGNQEKRYVLKEILSKGNFNKHLVGVVKLLMEKNKLGIVDEVLMEFERIYDQLCGTQVVLVSSEVKLEKDKVFGIAKKVQQLSGAEKMKVKVRNLVDDQKRSRSFAM
ncbi:ATP synthase subunit delta, chloroplastic-like [Solanum dulcamara]|uniref:ATP synthase subunit delta, chloroplastic-like n=1 Tax=Solanum dulcamara TaxID=45834 RepID=UPI0024855D99|nr:ATP synthase subunit delta, chloroplastic-like [Solanum dulcamara]